MTDSQDELKKEVEALTRRVIPRRPYYRADYQMTLGSLIKALTKERTSLPVYVEFPAITFGSPGIPHSYFGYHSDIAFVPQIQETTVAQFLKVCQECVDKSFIAPEGSPGFYRDYTMEIKTPVWISELDSASKLAVVDVISESDSVTLKTEIMVEKEE
tara:strand:+ start:137 stop:610 length:474 start_codon:yes stop_codon:yes gene_type:complete